MRSPWLRWVLFCLASVLAGAAWTAEPDIAVPNLTAEEKAWLADHPVVRLGVDAGYGPYSFLDDEGLFQGMVADFVAEIERSLGIRFEIVSDLAWPELLAAVRERRLDAVATEVRLPEREDFLEFTGIYLPTPLVVMTRAETPQLRSLDALERLLLSLVAGYSSSRQVIERYPELRIHSVATPLEGLRAVASGVSDAYVGVLGVNTFLAARHGIANLKVNAAFDMADNGQRIGVRKDWPQLAHILDKTLAAIPADRRAAIFQRWLPVQARDIRLLSRPGIVARLFPWLLGALGLLLLAYFGTLFWNRKLQHELARRRLAIEDSEARLKAAEMIAHAGNWEYRVADGHIQWSDETYRIFGLDPQSRPIDYEWLIARIHPDDRAGHDDKLRIMLESRPGDAILPYHFRLRRPNGDERQVWVHVRVEYGPPGIPTRLFGTVQDITETMQQADALRQSEARYRGLFDNMSDGLAIYEAVDDGADFVFRDYNRAGELIGSLPRDQVIGRRVSEVFPGVAEMGLLEALRQVWRTGEEQHHPVSQYRDDRISLWVENHVFRLPGGEVVAVYADITLRKQAEQALRESQERFLRALENIPDVVVIYDRELRIQYINAATRRLTGRRTDDYIGRRDDEVWPAEVYQVYLPTLKQALETGRMQSIETDLTLPETGLRSLNITCVPLIDESGQVREILGITHDLTERKRWELEIGRLNAELEQRVQQRTAELAVANQELETFTYSVSHDLKSPLRGIDGYSRLLLQDHREQLDEEGRLFLNNIRQGVGQMGELIDDLLAYSRMERRNLDHADVDLRGLVEHVLAERQAEIETRGVQLRLDLPPLSVRADPEGLALVLRNLLDNALKFSRDARPPEIEIVGEVRENATILKIADNGIGFDVKFQERIFDIFQRLQRAEDYPGTGIGLAIVRKALARMGGRVWAESTPGQGAAFFIELPC